MLDRSFGVIAVIAVLALLLLGPEKPSQHAAQLRSAPAERPSDLT